MLGEFLHAGICYHAETLQKIWRGATRQPQWQWSHDSHAQARLALKMPDETMQLVNLDGLHYLDEATGELGKLKLSRRAWLMLEHMPPIPPGETELLAQWPPHPLLVGIPPPPAPPVLRDIRATLQPILMIGASRDPDRDDYVFHLQAWAEYDGCRLPLAQEPWRQHVVRRVAGKYLTVWRMIESELSAWRAMAGADIVSLDKLLPSARRTLVPVPNGNALGQRQHFRGGAETFAALEAIVQSLSRAGFRLEYDPELPFAVLPQNTELQATLSHGEQAGWINNPNSNVAAAVQRVRCRAAHRSG